MSENPVWRESMEIYFAEGHGFAVYFYLLIIFKVLASRAFLIKMNPLNDKKKQKQH